MSICNSKMGGASRNFAAVTKFLPQKLRLFANLSISRKCCAAKICSYTVYIYPYLIYSTIKYDNSTCSFVVRCGDSAKSFMTTCIPLYVCTLMYTIVHSQLCTMNNNYYTNLAASQYACLAHCTSIFSTTDRYENDVIIRSIKW